VSATQLHAHAGCLNHRCHTFRSLDCKLAQNAGRSGNPKILQRFSLSNCTHRTPAGLPFGMPGMGLLMLGAVQHAPQFGRHCMINPLWAKTRFSANRTLCGNIKASVTLQAMNFHCHMLGEYRKILAAHTKMHG
jgi:hypothetical protein